VRSVVDLEIKKVEEDSLREAFRGDDELGVAFGCEVFTELLDVAQDVDTGGSAFDWRAGYLDIILWIDKVLPFDIVGTDFSLEFVPAGGCHDGPSTVCVLVFF